MSRVRLLDNTFLEVDGNGNPSFVDGSKTSKAELAHKVNLLIAENAVLRANMEILWKALKKSS